MLLGNREYVLVVNGKDKYPYRIKRKILGKFYMTIDKSKTSFFHQKQCWFWHRYKKAFDSNYLPYSHAGYAEVDFDKNRSRNFTLLDRLLDFIP